MSSILAIDLGTDFTTTSYLKNGEPVIITRIPSVVQFGSMGQIIIGEDALACKIGNRENTVDGIKRFLGRSFKEIQKELPKYTFGVYPEENNIIIDVFYAQKRPEEIAELILKEVKNKSELLTGQKFSKAVLSVPASASTTQRETLKYSAERAGLEVLRIINETSAGILAYVFAKNKVKDENIGVYNFGGGMFDFSIASIKGHSIKILSTVGDTQLGGLDLVDETVKLILRKFREESGISIDINQSLLLKAELYHVAKEAMQNLTSFTHTEVNIQSAGKTENGEIVDLKIKLTRSDFEDTITPIINKTLSMIQQAIKDSNIGVSSLSKILFTGGCTKILIIRQMIFNFFVNYSKIKKEKDAIGNMLLDTFGNKVPIDPQDAIAIGSAVQIGIITKEIKHIKIEDIVTKSLGITIHYDMNSKIISKGSTLPIQKESIYTTVNDFQKELNIEIIQGEYEKASKNEILGNFLLKDIEVAPAGKPLVLVNFSIDESGIFRVSAKDKKTGSAKSIVLEKAPWQL